MDFFRRRASDYHEKVEAIIQGEITNVSIEKEPPMRNRSSYIFRPDFVLEKEGNTFIIEVKDQVKTKDVILFGGQIMGIEANPVIISYANPDVNTVNLADELKIKLIIGNPQEAVRKLKEVINEP